MLAALLLYSCANIGRPEGGPRDMDPPIFIGSDPKPNALNVKKSKIELVFDEIVTTDDRQINYVMLKANDFFLSSLRYFFEKGAFRFKDLACKEAIIKALSY